MPADRQKAGNGLEGTGFLRLEWDSQGSRGLRANIERPHGAECRRHALEIQHPVKLMMGTTRRLTLTSGGAAYLEK